MSFPTKYYQHSQMAIFPNIKLCHNKKKIHSELKSPATGTWELQTTKNGTYLVKIKSKEVLGETSGVVKLQVKNPKIAASQLWIKGIVYILGQ